MIETGIHWLLNLLSAPEVGLSSVFLISFVSATLLPLGSEPAVFAAVKAAPAMFWPIVGVATLGNTLGGVLDYWMGLGARKALAMQEASEQDACKKTETVIDAETETALASVSAGAQSALPLATGLPASRLADMVSVGARTSTARRGACKDFSAERDSRWFSWLKRFGAKTMLLAWVPGIGDPICTLGGWLGLPFWPSVGYMAIGKFLRYLMMTWLLLSVPDGFWRQVAHLLG